MSSPLNESKGEKSKCEGEDEETLPFLIDHIPEDTLKKAIQELNETPENAHLLEELKQKAKLEKVTQEFDFEDDLLRQFLRQAKYNVKKALAKLQTFVNFRKKNSNVFEAVDFGDISKTDAYQYCTPLPWRCKEGCTIVLFEQGKWDPKDIAFQDLIRLGITAFLQSLRNPVAQINGFKMIVDWKDTSLRQIKYINPSYLYTVYQSFMDCTPARNKEIHLVNESILMKIMWTIMKPFLGEKLRKRIIFDSSPEDLLNYFPKHALPVQYGGDLENYYMEDWMREASEQQRVSTMEGQKNLF